MRRRLALVLLLAGGCGPSAALLVRIEAPLRVPEECDALHLVAVRGEGGPTVFERTYPLSRSFPLELSLTTENEDNLGTGRILITAEALLAGKLAQAWATRTAPATLREGQVSELRLPLCDCTPP